MSAPISGAGKPPQPPISSSAHPNIAKRYEAGNQQQNQRGAERIERTDVPSGATGHRRGSLVNILV
ncbi:MAG: hypothetical protein IT559_05470 [Alphaproteobacteria bacterium]|nr:hypothetical protein [Alphaproteobacteria bacterium]